MITINWKEWSDFANDEAQWLNHEERGLLKAEHVRDYILRLWLEEDLDVSIYELDFRTLILSEDAGEVFSPLREKERFCLVHGDYALIWPNPETGAYDEKSIDLAPECVRFYCEHYGKKLKEPDYSTPRKRSAIAEEAAA